MAALPLPPPPAPPHITTAGAVPTSNDAWKPGDAVRVEGLASRADLNGQRARVLNWDPATSRFAVLVASSGERVKVRSGNLTSAKRLLVAVVSGLAGSGKRALVHHLASAARMEGLRAALLVNGAEAGGATVGADVDLPGGCICCGLAGEFAAAVARLAQSGEFDHVLVESSDLAEPQQIAELFRSEVEGGEDPGGAEGRRARRRRRAAKELLQGSAELDTMLSILDAATVCRYLQETGAARSDPAAADSDMGTAGVTDLLVHQVELADMVVVNDQGSLSDAQARDVRSFISALNPEAGCLFSPPEQVPTYEALGRGAYMWQTLGALQPSRKWLQESARGFSSVASAFSAGGCAAACCAPPPLSGGAAPAERSGVDSFTFRPARPFHAARVMALVNGNLTFPPSVLRITGTCWLASRPARRASWSTRRGGPTELGPGAPWWACVPRTRWPDAVAQQLADRGLLTPEGQWSDERFGDCHSELSVVAGHGFKAEVLEVYLTELLLSDAEYAMGPAAWASFEDPLPPWGLPLSPDALYCLALSGAPGPLEALCAQGADVDAACSLNGGTALHAACLRGRVEIAELLLARRADPARTAQRCIAPLHLASSPEVVELLRRHGCDMQPRDANGHTPLHHAVGMGKARVVAALLRLRAEVDALTSAGETPLQLAAASAHPAASDVTGLLVAAGAARGLGHPAAAAA